MYFCNQFCNNNLFITNKIFSYLVKKAKKSRKSFNKKITSDDILNYNKPKYLSDSDIDLDSICSTTSSSKIYIKSNNSNYSSLNKTIDLMRVSVEEYDMFNLDSNIDYNHEIVLPYQRFKYNKNQKVDMSKCYDNVDDMIEYNN